MCNIPLLWGNDFDNSRLHAVLVNLVDKFLEIPELVHSGFKDRNLAAIPIMVRLNLLVLIIIQLQLTQLAVLTILLLLMIHLFTAWWRQGVGRLCDRFGGRLDVVRLWRQSRCCLNHGGSLQPSSFHCGRHGSLSGVLRSHVRACVSSPGGNPGQDDLTQSEPANVT